MSQMSVFLDAVDSTDEVIIKWNSLGNASDNPQRATHISCPDSLTLNNFQRSEWKGKKYREMSMALQFYFSLSFTICCTSHACQDS